VRARGHFPNEEAALKLIWLQLREVTKEWKNAAREWHAAKAQFGLLFGDRSRCINKSAAKRLELAEHKSGGTEIAGP